jgi:DNA-binding CsgD family transcriptional regulator
MNGHAAEAIARGDTREIAVDLNPGCLHGTRVVLWVVSDKGFDASSLAKHLAAAHGGAASVTLVSVEEMPVNAARHMTPIGELFACDPHPMTEREARPVHQGLPSRLGDAMGERLGDLAGRSAESPTTAGCATQTPPRSLSANGAAPIDGDAPGCARGLPIHAVFDPRQARAPGGGVAQAADRSIDNAKDALTPREAQVVELLRNGFTNKEIARRLGVMEDTVKKHLQSVFAKLGVHRRALVVLHPSGGPANCA